MDYICKLQEISSESDEFQSQNSSNSQQDQEYQLELKQQSPILRNDNIPFFQFRESFAVFEKKRKSKLFSSYYKAKQKKNVELLKSAIERLKYPSKQQDLKRKYLKKQSNQPYQHYFVTSIPKNTTLFFHIYKINNLRCNLRMMNSSGHVLAYLSEIKISRRFHKIYKLLKRIKQKTKSLVMINDQATSILKQLSFVKNLSTYSANFCYYTQFECQNLPIKISDTAINEDQHYKINKNNNVLVKNNVFWYFSDIFVQEERMQLIRLLKQMSIIQMNTQNQYGQTYSRHDQNQLGFIIQSILINFRKQNALCSQKYSQYQVYDDLLQMIERHQQSQATKSEPVFGNPLIHNNMEKMAYNKKCIFCQNNPKHRGKVPKTKYRCEGCSATEKRDIPLCRQQCMNLYHQKIKYLKLRKEKKMLTDKNNSKTVFKQGRQQNQSQQFIQQTSVEVLKKFKKLAINQQKSLNQSNQENQNAKNSDNKINSNELNQLRIKNIPQESQENKISEKAQNTKAQSEENKKSFSKFRNNMHQRKRIARSRSSSKKKSGIIKLNPQDVKQKLIDKIKYEQIKRLLQEQKANFLNILNQLTSSNQHDKNIALQIAQVTNYYISQKFLTKKVNNSKINHPKVNNLKNNNLEVIQEQSSQQVIN